jgi:pimeloyl-ACP methyl ester carboxylesterase
LRRLTSVAEVEGRPLYTEEHPGRTPAVVLLHHGANSLRTWDELLPKITGGRRTLAYDRRGFGSSPRDAVFDRDLFERDTDDLAELLRERDAAPAHLVGHSDGATVALLSAARHPDLVLSVTAISGHLRVDSDLRETMRAFDPPSRWDEKLRATYRELHGGDWEEVVGAWNQLWTGALLEWDIEEELAAIQCPVLVIHDRADPLAAPEHAEGLGRQVQGAVISWYETGTHGPHRRARERFENELESHLLAAEAQQERSTRP